MTNSKDTPALRGFGVRGKLIGLLVGTSFVALLLACGAFVYYDRVSYAEAKRATLSVLVDSVGTSAYGPTAFQDPDSAKLILKVLESEPTAQGGAIYAKEDGSLLASWQRKGTSIALPGTLAKLDRTSGYRADKLQLTRPIKGEQEVGTLHVVFSTDDIRERTARFLQIAGGVLLFAVLLSLVIASLAHRVLTRPVELLSTAARHVQHQQDFNVRAQRVSNDELGQLTDAFNAMLAMIQLRDSELEKHRIGLESTVLERTRDLDRRNQEMRLVLDNVDQGILMIDRAGLPSAERSTAFDRWFGAPEPGQTFGDIVARASTHFGVQFGMQWEQLIDGILPVELNLAQLPSVLASEAGRHYQLAYRVIGEDPERFEKLLVVASDVTEQVEKARSGAEQAQLIALLEHVSADRGGFLNFFNETEEIVARLSTHEARDRTVVMRELHTLKGNFGLFGLHVLALHVHELEDDCMESGEPPTPEDRQDLAAAWNRFAERARTMLGENTRTVSVDRSSVERLLEALRQKRPAEEIVSLAGRLMHEPVAPKLARMGERARALAERLGKGGVLIDVEADGVVAPSHLNWLWQVLPHVVANSVDHGLDQESERLAQGKSGAGKLRIAAMEQPSAFIVEVTDDGRGIDWERVRARAQKLGLPSRTHEDLVGALFSDGVTTREQATEVSGRGIGLAAVEAACQQHGASIRVSSESGKGTTFRFTVRCDNDLTSVARDQPRRSGAA